MIEIHYRQTVSIQHETAKGAQLWHDEGLLVGLHFRNLVAYRSSIAEANLSSSRHCRESQISCKECSLRIQVEYRITGTLPRISRRSHLQTAT
jgi:hypothetical protein